MQKRSLFEQSNWRWILTITAVLAVLSLAVLTFSNQGTTASAASSHHHSHKPSSGGSHKTVTVWIQATDSCMQAVPGASFVVNGPGVANKTIGPTPGTRLVGLKTYMHYCPVDRGTCVQTTTGCTSVTLNVPSSGTAPYTITPKTVSGKQ